MTPLATDDRDRAQRRPVGRGRRSPPRWRLTLAGHVPSAGGSAEHATQAAAESSGDSLLRPRKAPLSSPASGPACSAQGPSGARTEARAPRAPSRPRPLGRAATTARGHRPAGQRPYLQAAVCFIWTLPCPRLSPCPRCPSGPLPGPTAPSLLSQSPEDTTLGTETPLARRAPVSLLPLGRNQIKTPTSLGWELRREVGAGRGRVGVVKALGEGVMEDGQAPEVGRGRAPGPWAEGGAAPAAPRGSPRPQLCSRRPPPRDHRGSLHGASQTTDFPPLARPITPATRLWSQVHPTAVTSGGTSRSPPRLLPGHLQDQTRHGHHKGPRGPAPAQPTAASSAAD